MSKIARMTKNKQAVDIVGLTTLADDQFQEALQAAIDAVFPDHPDTYRADLYTRIVERCERLNIDRYRTLLQVVYGEL